MPSFEEPEAYCFFCRLSVGHSTNGFRSFSKQRVIYWWKAYRFIIRNRLGYVQTILELEKCQLYAVSIHFPQRFRGAQVFYKHLVCFALFLYSWNKNEDFWFDHYKDLIDNFIVNPNLCGVVNRRKLRLGSSTCMASFLMNEYHIYC